MIFTLMTKFINDVKFSEIYAYGGSVYIVSMFCLIKFYDNKIINLKIISKNYIIILVLIDLIVSGYLYYKNNSKYFDFKRPISLINNNKEEEYKNNHQPIIKQSRHINPKQKDNEKDNLEVNNSYNEEIKELEKSIKEEKVKKAIKSNSNNLKSYETSSYSLPSFDRNIKLNKKIEIDNKEKEIKKGKLKQTSSI